MYVSSYISISYFARFMAPLFKFCFHKMPSIFAFMKNSPGGTGCQKQNDRLIRRSYIAYDINLLHRHDHAAIVGVHAADTAGVHDQASFELCLFHKKLLHGLGAVRSIAVGDHQETFLRIPCLFQNDLRHSSECFLHADALASARYCPCLRP